DYPDWADELDAGGSSWRGYADALRAARRIHWGGRLDSYDGNVLVLNGERDTPHVRAQERLVSSIPHGRAAVVEGAGHLANLDRPDEYAEAVRRFARSLAS